MQKLSAAVGASTLNARGYRGFIALAVVIMAGGLGTRLAGAAGAQPQVIFNDPYANGPIEPTEFRSYLDLDWGGIRLMHWESWGGLEASGVGQLAEPNVEEPVNPVRVTLSGRQVCEGHLIYTRYTLAPLPGTRTSRGWSRARFGVFPCTVVASNEITEKNARTGNFESCAFLGLGETLPRGHWIPLGRARPLHGLGLCGMRWLHFGRRPTTEGSGVAREDSPTANFQWPARARLSTVAWCHEVSAHSALSYTRLEVTLYGRGESLLMQSVTQANAKARELSHEVGRRGLRPQRYRYSLPILSGCTPLAQIAKTAGPGGR